VFHAFIFVVSGYSLARLKVMRRSLIE